VSGVAFSPDGQTVLTGSADQTARLWDAHTGQARGKPMKHDGQVNAVCFSPDGLEILTGCGKNGRTNIRGEHTGEARLWDAHTGQPLSEPMKHDGPVTAVAFSPDGQRILTGGDDATARLWDVRTGHGLGDPLMHDDSVRSVAFSSNGQAAITVCGGFAERRPCKVTMWDVPPPATNDLEWLQLSVEVRTGLEFDETSGTTKRLKQSDWLKRQERLWNEFGGPCDRFTWNEVRDADKQQHRQPPKQP
jgi:eukaryotic-like serine/threonine-protein kinase